MRLLHIDSSVTGMQSISRALSAEIVAHIAVEPGVETRYRDLAAAPLAHYRPHADDPAVAEENETVLTEYIEADTVVIGVPLYNFGVPSNLKTWIDRIVIVGRTFRYDTDGSPVGLVPDKRIILAVARGGIYARGSRFEAWEHGESHLRTIFGFIGIHHCEVVIAEGLAISAEHRVSGVAAARETIAAMSPAR